MQVKFDTASLNRSIQALVNRLELKNKNAQATAKEIINTVTDRLHSETTRRTPIEEGILTDSVEKKVVAEGAFATDVTGYIFIPANSPASEYAIVMHEDHYNLGPASIKKQDAEGVTVGSKYMERAFEENKPAFEAYIVARLKKALF